MSSRRLNMEKRIRVLARVKEGQAESKEVIETRCKSKDMFYANDPDIEWYKQNIPCMYACPANTRVPEYLDSISRGDFNKTYLINRSDNVFPHTLGRVCSHPCETACRHGFEGMGDPVSICWLKRAGGDYKGKGKIKLEAAKKKAGKKIAIVGAGPAGLTLANDLSLRGYMVTVYEALSVAGGMLYSGIPAFRLPRALVKDEIKDIKDLGVDLKLNTRIGKEATLQQLKDKNDAVCITAGCMVPVKLDIPGEDYQGVIPGLDFMMQVNTGKLKGVRGTVVVVGGGFTAMDCSRTALRLGAKRVIVIYRRTRNEMLVDERELKETSLEGVEFQFLVSPVRIASRDGERVSEIECVKNKLGEPGPDGRKRPAEIKGSEFKIKTDWIIPAVSQQADPSLLPSKLNIKTEKGMAVVDKDSYMTSEKGIFACGDFISGPRNIISAIGEAHRVAQAIDLYLTGREMINEKVVRTVFKQSGLRSITQWKAGHYDIYDVIPREEISSLKKDQRTRLEKEVDLGYKKETGQMQADRCYLCNHNIQIDEKDCILCANCVDVCPHDCIKIARKDQVMVGGRKENLDVFYMLIDEERCIRCGLCLDVCPTTCLYMEKFQFEKEFVE
jgi:formate dehydrogenase major subunit